MIVPMLKVYAAVRRCHRDQLLDRVADLGVVHLTPVDPTRAVADEEIRAGIERLERAIQVLAAVPPAGERGADRPPDEAARAVLDIQRRSAEHRTRLAALHRELERLGPWRDVSLAWLEQLRAAGITVRCYAVPNRDTGDIRADCVAVLGPMPGKRALVAVAQRAGEPGLPPTAIELPAPPRDADAIRAEAAEIDAVVRKDARLLGELAPLADTMRLEVARLRQRLDYVLAMRGAADRGELFAVQGWIPVDQAERLGEGLKEAGIPAAVRVVGPDLEDVPPTLVRYPRWTKPIEGLFRILGTVAGYREFDVSVPFMIALPIFAAMLISDAGYGLILGLVPLLAYRRCSQVLGASFTQLLIVVGAAATGWGLLCGSFFGWMPYTPPVPVDQSESSRRLLMTICFVIGATHLSVAQLWRAAGLFPNLRFLNRIGWALFIWGMLGVVLYFVLRGSLGRDTPWPYLLGAGAALAILFAAPQPNVLRMLLLGVADFPLSMLSAFSDIISYVRLMAVGLASSILASQFNDLALRTGAWPLTVLVLVFGHGLNVGLALVALFAHGVRLNMLEFSNNLGMQWTGYPYRPFVRRPLQECPS